MKMDKTMNKVKDIFDYLETLDEKFIEPDSEELLEFITKVYMTTEEDSVAEDISNKLNRLNSCLRVKEISSDKTKNYRRVGLYLWFKEHSFGIRFRLLRESPFMTGKLPVGDLYSSLNRLITDQFEKNKSCIKFLGTDTKLGEYDFTNILSVSMWNSYSGINVSFEIGTFKGEKWWKEDFFGRVTVTGFRGKLLDTEDSGNVLLVDLPEQAMLREELTKALSYIKNGGIRDESGKAVNPYLISLSNVYKSTGFEVIQS